MNRFVFCKSAAPVSLRSAVAISGGGVEVDAEKGIIRNVAVITAGVATPCNAEPFIVDETMLEQVAAAINAGRVQVRMTHPEAEGKDAIGWLVGSIGNARVLGGQVRADVSLEDFAAQSPFGDLRSYLLGVAAKMPESIGMSIVFGEGDLVEIGGALHGRIASLHAVDFVGNPAANPAGLLSKKVAAPPGAPAASTSSQGTKDGGQMTYTPAQIAYLQSIGLAQGATADEIAAFVASITPEQQAALDALAVSASDSKKSEAPASGAAPAAPAVSAPASGAVALAAASREKEILELATLAGKDTGWALSAANSGKSIAALRAELAQERAASAAPLSLGAPSVKVGEDRGRVALRSAVADAIALKGGLKIAKPHELSGRYRSLRMVDIGRRVLVSLGIKDADTWAASKVAQVMLNSRMLVNEMQKVALGAGDYYSAVGTFTGIFGDTANRGLIEGYTSFQRMWPKFARKYLAPDFKQLDRSTFGSISLASTAAGYDVTYAALGDRREVYSLAKYTGGTAFTWEQIVNDDLDAISGVPRKLGFLAAQKEDSVAFGVINTNAALQDTYAWFQAANHANYTASGTAISATSIGVGISQMMAQTDAGGSDPLNIMPGVLLCSPAKLALARQCVYGQVDPASSGGALNPWYGDMEVVSSGFLSGNAWYLFAKPGTPGESLEVAFLDGQEEPLIESEEDFDSKTMKMKVTHVVAAGAIDYRGAYKNAGA